MNRGFFDTNILIYVFENDRRAEIAEGLLQNGGTISVQVLNEFVHVCRHKKKLPIPSVRIMLDRVRPLLNIVPVSVRTHDRALSICDRYGFRIYDSLIVAAALDAGCDLLYSEDLQHGQRIDQALEVINPFR